MAVLKASERRNMERISPSWYPAPRHCTAVQKQRRTSLHFRIRTLFLPIMQSHGHVDVFSKLQDTCSALEPLETRKFGPVIRGHVTQVVQTCVSISKTQPKRSLESRLGEIWATLTDAERKSIAQIDKIGRYYQLCKDIVKLARRPTYRALFRNIFWSS